MNTFKREQQHIEDSVATEDTEKKIGSTSHVEFYLEVFNADLSSC